jgi:hypothetical protein
MDSGSLQSSVQIAGGSIWDSNQAPSETVQRALPLLSSFRKIKLICVSQKKDVEVYTRATGGLVETAMDVRIVKRSDNLVNCSERISASQEGFCTMDLYVYVKGGPGFTRPLHCTVDLMNADKRI